MGRIIAGSITWGAIFGTIAATVTALVMWCYWGSQPGGQHGIMLMALIMWVPAMMIMGGVGATALFGVVGVIASLLRPLGLQPSSISYAVVSGLLAYGLVIVGAAGGIREVHAGWVGSGLQGVLHGHWGSTDYLVRIFLPPTVIAGLLVGWKVRTLQERR